MNERCVLVIDDEPDVRILIRMLLHHEGLRVIEAGDGHEGVRAVHRSAPDLVVLDVAMPGCDGWDTLERIRDISTVPVIMLGPQSGEAERIRGLRAGADDVLEKPFGRGEFVARVVALLRRAGATRAAVTSYEDAFLSVDFRERIVIAGGREVRLSPREFRLLAALVRSAGSVLTRDEILQQAWDSTGAVMPEQVKLYIGYVRRKLGTAPAASPIETVRGVGYRYRPPTPRRHHASGAPGSSVLRHHDGI